MTQDSEPRHQKLKIKEILEGMTMQDIKVFITNYAKNDKAFDLAFKSHFLSRVFLGGDGTKYRRMLNELVKPKTAKNNKISPSIKKSINFILNDFVLQMKDCLSTEDYKEAFHISYESLDKILYLTHRFGVRDKTLEKNRLNFIEGLDVVLNQELAPTFRKKVEDGLRNLINKSYYRPGRNSIILILERQNAFTIDDKSRIINDLHVKSTEDIYDLNILRTSLMLSSSHNDLARDILSKYDHKNIFFALKILIEDHYFEIANYFIKDKNLEFNYQLCALNCYIHINSKDDTKLAKELCKLNPQNTDYVTFENIIELLSESFLRKEFLKIAQWVNSLTFAQCTKLHAKAHRYESLVSLIEKRGEIEWLKVYDALLIKNGRLTDVKELYLKFIDDYYDNHLGNKATELFERTKKHLFNISQVSILNDITLHLSKKYAHRRTVKSKFG